MDALRYSDLLVSSIPAMIVWLIVVLAEVARAPFDLIEGERELVGGFIVEVGRGMFRLLMIREYGLVLAWRCVSVIMFSFKVEEITIWVVVVCVVLRRCYPRVRYDVLMKTRW